MITGSSVFLGADVRSYSSAILTGSGTRFLCPRFPTCAVLKNGANDYLWEKVATYRVTQSWEPQPSVPLDFLRGEKELEIVGGKDVF